MKQLILRQSTSVLVVLLLLWLTPGEAAGTESQERYLVNSVELRAAATSEVALDDVVLEHYSDGSYGMSGSLVLPTDESAGAMITISADPDSETYSATLELVDASWFEKVDDDGYQNLLPDPGEGCPVQMCHRSARVGGRWLTVGGQPLINVTRADIDYSFKVDTLEVVLLDSVQKCVNHPQWALLSCEKPPPYQGGFNHARVEVVGKYGAMAIAMDTRVSIDVANGIQLFSWQYVDVGDLGDEFEGIFILSNYDCHTVLVY